MSISFFPFSLSLYFWNFNHLICLLFCLTIFPIFNLFLLILHSQECLYFQTDHLVLFSNLPNDFWKNLLFFIILLCSYFFWKMTLIFSSKYVCVFPKSATFWAGIIRLTFLFRWLSFTFACMVSISWEHPFLVHQLEMSRFGNFWFEAVSLLFHLPLHRQGFVSTQSM